jgi:hypothetical protein
MELMIAASRGIASCGWISVLFGFGRMRELGCAGLIPELFVLCGLRCTAQFLRQSSCDPYSGIVQAGCAAVGSRSRNGKA